LQLTNFHQAVLYRVNLSGSSLLEASLIRADLRYARLVGSQLDRASLFDANLSSSDLTAASLYRANLINARLNKANLTRATLVAADLTHANFSRAKLDEADLDRAQVADANFLDASISTQQKEYLVLHGARNADVVLESLIPSSLEVPVEIIEPRISLRFEENVLTLSRLATIISSLDHLTTKLWLIEQGRLDDALRYAETLDSIFPRQANIVVTRISYNSPLDISVKADVSAPSLAQGVTSLIDGIVQIKQRHKQLALENAKTEQEIEEMERKSLRDDRISGLEAKRIEMEILEKRALLQEKVQDMARKRRKDEMDLIEQQVNLLCPDPNDPRRFQIARSLLQDLARLGESDDEANEDILTLPTPRSAGRAESIGN